MIMMMMIWSVLNSIIRNGSRYSSYPQYFIDNDKNYQYCWCKNKTSADWNEIDMTTVKNVIDGIVKPITYICNLSFQTGTFPSKMKIAKVIPLYKAGYRHHY